MAGHAQLKFVMTECSKTQIRLTRLTLMQILIQPQSRWRVEDGGLEGHFDTDVRPDISKLISIIYLGFENKDSLI